MKLHVSQHKMKENMILGGKRFLEEKHGVWNDSAGNYSEMKSFLLNAWERVKPAKIDRKYAKILEFRLLVDVFLRSS